LVPWRRLTSNSSWLLQRQHMVLCCSAYDFESDRNDRRGPADVLSRIIAGLLFAIVGRIVYDATHRPVGGAGNHAPIRRLPLRMAFVIAEWPRWAAGLLRFVAELQFCWAGRSIVVGFGSGHRTSSACLYVARLAKAFFGDAPASPHMLSRSRAPLPQSPGLKLPACTAGRS